MTPSITERTDIVRKRSFSVRTSEEVKRVLDLLKLEGAECEVKVILRSGGTPTRVTVEERSQMLAIDMAY
jgi:hypothetical protein